MRGNKGGGTTCTDELAYLHPKIAKIMERVHEANNGSFRMRNLFEALNTPQHKVEWGTLLYMTK